MTDTPPIARHYQADEDETQLWHTLCQALESADISPNALTHDLLAPVDQLHTGGRKASEALLSQAKLNPNSQILEIGAGLGGASRMLADQLQAHVTAVDITPSFTFACQQINQQLGYNSIQSLCADACDLDQIETNTQDAVWSQHTIMNIPDKASVLNTLHRILRPGGKLLLHEIIAGENPEPLSLPVPWASEAGQSHLPDRQAFQQMLEQQGFRTLHWQDMSADALQWRKKHTRREQNQQTPGTIQKRSPLSPSLVFGDPFVTMGKNVQQNLADQKIMIIQAVLST